jgi:hypothetical protein
MALNNSSQVTLLRTADLLFAPSPDGDETELDGRASPLRKEKPPPTRYNYFCYSILCTTPGSGSAPKCMEPGAINVNVILEYSTSVPPVIAITTGDGSMVAGAGPPLSVNVAVPVT